MPLEDTPNFLQENTEAQPFKWIEDAGFDLHKSKLPSMDQVRAMTNVALDAAAASQNGGDYAYINTPDVFTPTPEQKPPTPSQQIIRHSSEWMRRSKLEE